MKRLISKIIIGSLCLYFGLKLVDLSHDSVSEETVQKYESLCINKVQTIGIYDSTYSVLKIKSAKISTLKFKYDVHGNLMTGEQAIPGSDAGPLTPTVTIWYDSIKPSAYSTEEPCAQAEIYRKKRKLPSGWIFFGGVVLVLFGLSRLYSSLIMIVGAIFVGLKNGVAKKN